VGEFVAELRDESFVDFARHECEYGPTFPVAT